jgi:hypothetical protein
LDSRHVCKTCAFHGALQAGKLKEVHPPYSSDQAPSNVVLGDLRSPRTTSLDTTRPSTIFYRLLLN